LGYVFGEGFFCGLMEFFDFQFSIGHFGKNVLFVLQFFADFGNLDLEFNNYRF